MHNRKLTGKLTACILVLGILSLFGCTPQPKSEMTLMTVSLLKVGKADAIVLQAKDAVLVIDTGEEDDGQELVDFLKKQGVSCVNALIITHFDKDHVGGADTLLEQMPVEQVFMPAYEGMNTEYMDFVNAMEEKRITPEALEQPVQFVLGDMQVQIDPPPSYDAGSGEVEMDNNFSLITTVIHGENRLLFMADAEKQRIEQWLEGTEDTECDFLKVPHHGVYTTALEDLLERMSPDYGVICTSEKHPADDQTVELLKQHGTDVFQTKDGNITLISDGRKLELRQKAR